MQEDNSYLRYKLIDIQRCKDWNCGMNGAHYSMCNRHFLTIRYLADTITRKQFCQFRNSKNTTNAQFLFLLFRVADFETKSSVSVCSPTRPLQSEKLLCVIILSSSHIFNSEKFSKFIEHNFKSRLQGNSNDVHIFKILVFIGVDAYIKLYFCDFSSFSYFEFFCLKWCKIYAHFKLFTLTKIV